MSIVSASTVVTGGTYINGPAYFGDGLDMQCPSGTTMPNCMQVDSSSASVLVGTGIAFNAANDGRIVVTNNGQLVVANAVTAAGITGASDTGHVVSTLVKNGTQAFNFPVGDGTRLGLVGISAPGNVGDAVSASFVYMNPLVAFGSTLGATVAEVSTNQYWRLQGVGNIEAATVSSSPSVNVTLYWSATNILPSSINFQNVIVTGWNGSQWVNLGKTNLTGNQTAGSITTAAPVNINAYMAFALGRSSASAANSTLTVTTNNQLANNTAQDIVTVTLNDINNQPVANTQVNFTVTGTASLAAISCTTDILGQCTVGVLSGIAGTYQVNAVSPVVITPVSVTFVAGQADVGAVGTALSVITSPAVNDNVSQAVVQASVVDASNNPIAGVVVTFATSGGTLQTVGTGLPDNTCTTNSSGRCQIGLVSAVATTYNITATIDISSVATPINNGSPAVVSFTSNPLSAINSSLSCLPAGAQIAGSNFTCTATARDTSNTVVSGATINLSSAAGSVISSASCTTDLAGECTFTVTSSTGGTYAVSAKIASAEVTNSPLNVVFNAPVIPSCVVSPNPATSTDTVSVACTGATPGDVITVPGCVPSPYTVLPDGLFNCSATGADLGNNPPITVTNANNISNTSTLDLQISPAANNPPPVPACVANPNPAINGQALTISCTGVQIGTTNVVPGAVCVDNPATSTTIVCTGVAGSGVGDIHTNPTITTTDTVTGLSNSSVIPLNVQTTAPALPICTVSPNPATDIDNVTITCNNGTPGDTVQIDGCTTNPLVVQPDGTVTCTEVGAVFGNNPAINVTDGLGNVVGGSIPLVLTPAIAVATAANSSLACTPLTAVTAGNSFSCVVTARDSTNTLVDNAVFSLSSATGSTVSASTCTTDITGQCSFTVTSNTGGIFAVMAQISLQNITGSPTNVEFTEPVIPSCTVTPNPATSTDPVNINCTGGTNGDQISIPGCPTQTVVAGSYTCTTTGATLGNNPPITVVNSNGISNTSTLPFQISPAVSNPPPVPVCISAPNPATTSDTIIMTCTGVQVGTTNVIPGATCVDNPATSTTVTCTSDAPGSVGTNPVITTTDPVSGLSNSSVIPLNVDTAMPALPNCTVSPSPAMSTDPVTVSCTNGTVGSTVNIPGCTPPSQVVPASGNISCTSTGAALGNNPSISVTDLLGNTVGGSLPLVMTPAPATAINSGLVCTPMASQLVGSSFSCIATARDGTNAVVQNVTFNLSSAVGSTVSAASCTTDVSGQCSFTVTSASAGTYDVYAQLGAQNISGSPDSVTFVSTFASVIPTCTVSPNPALATDNVAINCSGGTSGNLVSIPGCPSPQAVSVTGTYSCTTTGAQLGNNPPIRVTDASGHNANTAILPLQITPTGGNNPPPAPVCVSSPNPATSADAITVTCTGVQVGTNNTLSGAVCVDDPATSTTIVCTGTGSNMGTNPVITTTDPLSGLSNSTVVPLNVDTSAAALPTCSVSPNPAQATDNVVVSCTGATSGSTVTISGCTPASQTVPPSGSFTCSATGADLGNNPSIMVSDGLTVSGGSLPLLITPAAVSLSNSTLVCTPATAQPTTGSFTCVATVRDSNSVPMNGVLLDLFSSSSSVVTPLSAATCITDAAGECDYTVTTNVGGTYIVTAQIGGQNIAGSPVAVNFVATAPTIVVPSCIVTPNPATDADSITISCSGGTPGNLVSIPGCPSPQAVSATGTYSCTTTGAELGSNPPIRVTDPTGNNVSTAILPLVVTPLVGVAPALPACTANPNPATQTDNIIVTCTGVELDSTVTMTGALCSPSPATGPTVTCTGTGSSMGSSPIITITNGSGLSSSGIVPLVVSAMAMVVTPIPLLNTWILMMLGFVLFSIGVRYSRGLFVKV